jgi:hypothetical protein
VVVCLEEETLACAREARPHNLLTVNATDDRGRTNGGRHPGCQLVHDRVPRGVAALVVHAKE